MEPLPLHFFSEASHGRLVNDLGDIEIERVVTDSRTTRPGDLFVALRGDRFDAHDFISEAIDGGASAVLCSESNIHSPPLNLPTLWVRDTRIALGQIAAAYRARHWVQMVCIAGSNGKTTTKEWLAALLSTRFKTLHSEASFNNDVGVPLSLLRLDSSHAAAVIEAGTNHPGELAPLIRMIAPTVGLVPNIGREHLEHFLNLQGVIDEESALGEALPSSGTLFLNGDLLESDILAQRTKASVVRVGFGPQNDWIIRLIETRWRSTRFHLIAPKSAWTGEFELGMNGRHMVGNAVLALAAAAEMGVGPEEARQALAGFHGVKQRLHCSEIKGVRLIDDTYNANTDSMLAALQTLADIPCFGRRIAILGDMAELGSNSAESHREIGAAAADLYVNLVIAIGQFASITAQAARGSALCLAFDSIESALPDIHRLVQSGDLVLAKASRSSQLERVLESLRCDLQQKIS